MCNIADYTADRVAVLEEIIFMVHLKKISNQPSPEITLVGIQDLEHINTKETFLWLQSKKTKQNNKWKPLIKNEIMHLQY